MDQDAAGTAADRLRSVVASQFGDPDEWTVESASPDRVTVRLPDRTLDIRRRDGPDGADHWTIALLADGDTVSKFGPFSSVDGLSGQVRSLLDSDVRYTVCCDG